ncbi:S8 family serine peptidase [Aeromicrobium wangtongii]|uniref:S8 family serine peptidase n=1 Tax=Aeromicrobium wangtongii TaxID=2969247 RepID=UPI002016CAF6|nr:S8 family serine peptidase [Aeromicrobium wangtongii]MCL3817768.1 S8 family serine peptidase [Aeromicrobium wangtongii]
MALRRTLLTLTTGLALTIGMSPLAPAGAESVDAEAADILASAPSGEPVTVVTTTQTADGPQFSTKVTRSRGEALDVISSALDTSSVDAVDVAHPVSIAVTAAKKKSKSKKSKRVKRSNDTLRKRQWALNRLDVEKVWRKSSGKRAVVAVIDTGVWANHPDLKGRVLKGRDFIENDRSAGDRNGHGTHVAGIIAAKANNKRGIAGVAPSTKILPVRVLNAAGAGNTATVARGIVYAVNKKADVINLSLAGVQSDAQLQAAIRYAQSRNVVVVAAAGNRGCGAPASYPAAYPGVIGVGAIHRNGGVDRYSNCGSYVDLVAPGTSIRSTVIRHPSLGLPCQYGKDYCMMSGTSMAAPHVAAAAAILKSRTKRGMGPNKIRRLLLTKADDIVTPGYDTTSGFGVLNIKRSLSGR